MLDSVSYTHLDVYKRQGQGSAPNAHVKHKHENGVQDDVAYGPNEHGVHTCLGISLGIDKGVESKGQLYKNGSQGINLHVSPPVLYGIAAGSEHQQDAAAEDKEEGSQHNGHGYKGSGDVYKRQGFTVLMDDFGSGYSSLNMLKDVNVDVLKIDMKFLEMCIRDRFWTAPPPRRVTGHSGISEMCA